MTAGVLNHRKRLNIAMLKNTPCIRRATVEDLPSICELGQVVNRLHHEALPQVFALHPDPAEHEAHWLASLDRDDAATFLAYDDGAVVGFVTVQLLEENHCLLQPQRYARVGSVCVSEQLRGRGIGRALMEHAERWAATCGAIDIRLEVWKFNSSAVRLYQELGFETRFSAMSKPISSAHA